MFENGGNALYQEVILEHNKKPRNFKVLEDADGYALGKNPLCGDQFAVYVRRGGDGSIDDIGFQGSGCAIAKASASMMTTLVKGRDAQTVATMRNEFQRMVTGELDVHTCEHHLGRLTLFEGVKKFPVRVKCATLAWHTLDAALSGVSAEITTE